MVKFKPIRTTPNNLKQDILYFNETVAPGENAFAWAQSFGTSKVFFMEITVLQTEPIDPHLLNLSLMRLPELTLNSYTGQYVHDLMLRQWSNFRSAGDYPMYSSFPSNLRVQDGEALVIQFQNDSGNTVTCSAELALYYSGGLLKVLEDY